MKEGYRYYILEGHKLVPCDCEAWSAYWIGNSESRRVALDTIGGIDVSTVFLGIDHNFWGGGPPELFETMLFGDIGDLAGIQFRYATWDEAEAGHKAIVRQLQGTSGIV